MRLRQASHRERANGCREEHRAENDHAADGKHAERGEYEVNREQVTADTRLERDRAGRSPKCSSQAHEAAAPQEPGNQ